MSEKKGFFSFLGIGGNTAFTEEEKQQKEFAKTKSKEVEIEVDEFEGYIDPEFPEEVKTTAIETLEMILKAATFNGTIKIQKIKDNHLNLEIENSEDAGRLIGKEGNTLDSLQTLVRAITYKKHMIPFKVTIDAGDYRKKRVLQLRERASRAADTVMRKKRSISLRSMSASDRRDIHLMFENDENIRTYSVGEGRERHVVLTLKQDVPANQ